MKKKIRVMVNGLPGKMATKVVEHVLGDDRLELVPYSYTGESAANHVISGQSIHLLVKNDWFRINEIINDYGPFITVDFTLPSAVISNAYFYCNHKLPFVMGTTGGDRDLLHKTIKESMIPAVIAPNMAKPIVVFQEMMAYTAKTFPDVFGGYSLEIVESHQKGKADTSGTAKAMIKYFNELGIHFSNDQIRMIREPLEQIRMGVPENALGGHGWHAYTLKSADGSVLLQFTHNVNGREVYATGTIDAIFYLQKKIEAGVKGKVFSMIDVAKGV